MDSKSLLAENRFIDALTSINVQILPEIRINQQRLSMVVCGEPWWSFRQANGAHLMSSYQCCLTLLLLSFTSNLRGKLTDAH